MFFVLSKLVWFVLSPVNLAILLAALAALLAFTRFAWLARWFGAAAMLFLILMAFSPLPRLVMWPLENRFPQQPAEKGPVAGIIVLGGSIGVARGDVVLTSAGARMTKAVELARLHPEARIVFAGGAANLISPVTKTESDGASVLFEGLGIARKRIVLEDKSRNTRENAMFTKQLVDPKPGERWLLVTSAWHMPRSMGVFRKAGFDVEAFPVDYLTEERLQEFLRVSGRAPRGLMIADDGFKEWVGLVAYRLVGYTDALFPGP
ncbi:hypothetical protein ASE63_17225 [Bosea sp. Root381]|uniref:YdcF family protein n=1 Tax=Bosea sp. Root381 TaxID=1736524 RepID=UPI0006FE4EAE|nr:YdcF family protein [Bosea sp. Root381]KRE14993.1 hypothetical protein ASE63_17225 [Bosea sp. Root381]